MSIQIIKENLTDYSDSNLHEKILDKKQSDTLFISFSGGETSAFMTLWCMANMSKYYEKTVVIFSNTGQENQKTLDFVRNVSEYYKVDVIWLEAKVFHGQRKGTSFNVVDYESADTQGVVFEEVIKKYGIPNKAYPHCTRELKLAPMRSYLKDLGIKDYDTCVGIRSDEFDRVSVKAKENKIIYPLISFIPTTKKDVNTFWRDQPFRLGLKGYEGNCKWCWKKSNRKHFTLMSDDPTIYDFPKLMEAKYGLAGHNLDGNRRVFFRGNLSTEDMFKLKEKSNYKRADDDSTTYNCELDSSNGCEESCEVNFEDLVG